MFLMKKLTRLLEVEMGINECDQLIRKKHTHIELAKI